MNIRIHTLFIVNHTSYICLVLWRVRILFFKAVANFCGRVAIEAKSIFSQISSPFHIKSWWRLRITIKITTLKRRFLLFYYNLRFLYYFAFLGFFLQWIKVICIFSKFQNFKKVPYRELREFLNQVFTLYVI